MEEKNYKKGDVHTNLTLAENVRSPGAVQTLWSEGEAGAGVDRRLALHEPCLQLLVIRTSTAWAQHTRNLKLSFREICLPKAIFPPWSNIV